MSTVHIYRAPEQPATHFRCDLDGPHPTWFRYPGRKLGRCEKCRKRRWYSNMTVQVYYDAWRFLCAKGKGCRG